MVDKGGTDSDAIVLEDRERFQGEIASCSGPLPAGSGSSLSR